MSDALFARGDKARSDAQALAQQLADLRELRALELDLCRAVRGLATALDTFGTPTTGDGGLLPFLEIFRNQ